MKINKFLMICNRPEPNDRDKMIMDMLRMSGFEVKFVPNNGRDMMPAKATYETLWIETLNDFAKEREANDETRN